MPACQPMECRLEIRAEAQPAGETVQSDYFSAGRESGNDPRALHRLAGIRQHRDAREHTALPIVGPARDGSAGKPPQIAQRQVEQPARPRRRRLRRQHTEGNRSDPASRE